MSSRIHPRLSDGVRDLLLRFSLGFTHLFPKPSGAEVFPSRIVAFDQPDFLLVTPLLDFFLARDGHAYVSEEFIVHKAENAVSGRESRDEAGAVLRDTAFQIVCDARVEVSRAARKDIDVVGAAHGPIVEGQSKKRKADSSPR